MCDSSSFSLFCFVFFLRIEFPLQKEKPLIFMKSFENFSSFIFWNLLMEICPLKIGPGDFSFSWRCVHGDLSFEDLFRRFFPFSWRCVHGDLSFEDLFRRFFLLKFCFGDLSFWKFVRRFVIWKLKYRRFFLLISDKKNKSWFLVS